MFLTVTLNPALDKTLVIPRNAPHCTVRASGSITLAGGKGLNVARALLGLGAPVRAFLPVAGRTGEEVAALAAAEGMDVAAVPVAGTTRMALTIREEPTGEYWHYLEPGPALAEQDLTRLREGFLWALEGCHTLCICGSLPSPAAAPLLPWMIRAARERGLRVALDSFGPLQQPALAAGAWLVKPNLEEWAATCGEVLETEEQRWQALEWLAARDTALAVLSMGAAGALALAGGARYRVLPPSVREVNQFGSGDSMLAGLVWAAARQCSPAECLAWGAACGAASAAVWDPGGIQLEHVRALLPAVRVVPA